MLDVTAFFTKFANFSKEHPDLSRERFAEFVKIHLYIERDLLPGSSTDSFKGIFMPPLTFSSPVLRKNSKCLPHFVILPSEFIEHYLNIGLALLL
jgi:hypothetical protein